MFVVYARIRIIALGVCAHFFCRARRVGTRLSRAAPPQPTPTAMTLWVLQSLHLLDYPGGRYTQIRCSPVDGLPTMVWNGQEGLRLSRCVDPVCSSWTPPVTLSSADPNPRFIRMEFSLGLPVLVYAAANDTELHVTRCTDQACAAMHTLVVGRAQTVRHPGLSVTEEGDVVVAAELSNASLAPTGCTLTLLLVATDPLAVLRSVEERKTDTRTPSRHTLCFAS